MRIITVKDFAGSGRAVHLHDGLMGILELIDAELKRHWCDKCGGLEVEMQNKIGDHARFRIVKGRKGRE